MGAKTRDDSRLSDHLSVDQNVGCKQKAQGWPSKMESTRRCSEAILFRSNFRKSQTITLGFRLARYLDEKMMPYGA
ncbi:MAG: hypothetical protein ACXWIH_11370, partial [Burkholderiales bacterium]